MPQAREYILIVEPDPLMGEMIARQALQAAGYRVHCVGEATAAISSAVQTLPDVILCDVNLPGLSSKDLLVALSAQGLNIPVILIGPKGSEADLIQNFRLGAVDYLLWPTREPEILAVVERVLKQVRERREREQLAQALQRANQELQQRLDELNTIFTIGKALTSLTHQGVLFEQLLTHLLKVTRSDLGWLLLKDEQREGLILAAGMNLPSSLLQQRGQPWEDGVSHLVALSGEALTLSGEPLKRLRIAILGQAALLVPIKAAQQVIGILVLMRKKDVPYQPNQQRLVEAVADFASISLANARLFRALEERARLQQGLVENATLQSQVLDETLQRLRLQLNHVIEQQTQALDRLSKDPTTRWSPTQRQALTSWRESLEKLQVISALLPSEGEKNRTVGATRVIDLNQLLVETTTWLSPLLQHQHINLLSALGPQPLPLEGDERLVRLAVRGVLAIALALCDDGQVHLRSRREGDEAQIEVQIHSDLEDAQRRALQEQPLNEAVVKQLKRFSGLGLNPALIRQILSQTRGKIWVEGVGAQGLCWHLTFPLAKSQVNLVSSPEKATEKP
jgi:DNA-binding response OmpR family regulator